MSSKTRKRIKLRLRLFKVRGNNEMVFLHRPANIFETVTESASGSRLFRPAKSKFAEGLSQ